MIFYQRISYAVFGFWCFVVKMNLGNQWNPANYSSVALWQLAGKPVFGALLCLSEFIIFVLILLFVVSSEVKSDSGIKFIWLSGNQGSRIKSSCVKKYFACYQLGAAWRKTKHVTSLTELMVGLSSWTQKLLWCPWKSDTYPHWRPLHIAFPAEIVSCVLRTVTASKVDKPDKREEVGLWFSTHCLRSTVSSWGPCIRQ